MKFGTLLPGAVLTLAMAGAQAAVTVEGTARDLGASWLYEFTIGNDGPLDVIIVTLPDAPLADPLIDATLAVPGGYAGSYDGGLGIVDFLEDTMLFAAATSVGGFSFESLADPASAFMTFEAIDLGFDIEFGVTDVTIVPLPGALAFVLSALAALGFGRRARRTTTRQSITERTTS